MKSVSCVLFLDSKAPLIDVRSPAEFSAGHIIGAVNVPLFSDDERAEVGTLYKQSGRETAIKMGLELVGPNLCSFIEQVEKLKSKQVRVQCWRGGMRSQSMAWLLETYGFETTILEGGYKAYRNAILDFFAQEMDMRILSGYTGSMKTQILLAMREMGAQVIDLEGAAGHQGSSFGNVLSEGQPSTEHFHNLTFEQAREFDLTKPIWIEDESNMIGKVAMISTLFKKKETCPHFMIEIPLDARLDHLVNDYGEVQESGLISATDGIRKKLGNEQADASIALIKEGKLKEASAIILTYYDKQYQRALDKKKELIKEFHSFDHADIQEIARHLHHGRT
jgi:tRNA 2-selenouridine synthase